MVVEEVVVFVKELCLGEVNVEEEVVGVDVDAVEACGLVIRLFGEGDLIGLSSSSSSVILMVLVSAARMGLSSSLMVSRADGFFEGRPRFLGIRI